MPLMSAAARRLLQRPAALRAGGAGARAGGAGKADSELSPEGLGLTQGLTLGHGVS